MERMHDIYDRIAKRCLSLSTRCTVNLINGLFGTDYPVDSEVTYNWTENTDDELKRTLADTIVTINQCHSYHIEFQMTIDGDIIMRILEYGFRHAMNRQTGLDVIHFPEPLIVYLYDRESFPDEYTLKIHFGKQGVFDYKVPVFKYLNQPMEELNRKKLIVLLPFQLLRLRRAIEKERTQENMGALKKLISHDILDSLKKNVDAGNITHTEAGKLSRMVLHLYHHIYDGYEELEEEGVGLMAEEALIFDIDILDHEIKKLTQANQFLEEEKQALGETNQALKEEKQKLQEEKKRLLELLSRTHTPEEIEQETGIELSKTKLS